MHGGERYAQARPSKHHHGLVHPTRRRQILGMSGMREASALGPQFREGSGNQTATATCARRIRCGGKRNDSSGTTDIRRSPQCHRNRQRQVVKTHGRHGQRKPRGHEGKPIAIAKQNHLAHEFRLSRQGAQDDFVADPGWVT